ncbi:ARM repeat-containing protein [Calocera viscosa TUFC12733]|uniref:ARM repeat-containing protein n=1 Tax=Calocera viscosa (strain TUFC12733) TaxID=1330018 RepID=A0A167M5T9_CALVF|nr:ARM repeat-containing protein [Calocera viscosa TUFC12733]
MVPSSHTPPPIARHRTPSRGANPQHATHTPSQGINYLSYLQPASTPPYAYFCERIVRVNDQQASIFIQQKLKAVDGIERSKIVDAIVEKGLDLMTNRFGNWAVQRCLEDPCTAEERAKVVSVMRGHVVELATSPYGTHVVQKALDGDERCKLLVVNELLMDDPGETLINKHASHVWSKIMELQWDGNGPPIFEYVNHALRGKWAQLACHETGSLVAQHVFENLSEELKRPCVEEVLDNLSMCAKNQWGSWVVQHIVEHGSPEAKARSVSILTREILGLATDQQGVKSLDKALKQGDPMVLDGFVRKMAEPRVAGKRAIIVDMALTLPGSQFITQILNLANREQRAMLSDALRSHVVTLKGSRTGAKVIWML